MSSKKQTPILVTQPSLPDLKDFTKSLEKIWESKWLTNNGQFHQEFEKKLANHLGVNYISLFSNGTLGLITALQHLEIKGEVITTPYSFVATAHALQWNGITPVFCDVDPVYGNLDPDQIESLITEKTDAIMPVHVYGNPVQHKKIEAIAKKHGLKLIYDAAHAFGVEQNNESIINYGDLSILSFHATKTFNTIEGGAIICHDVETKKQIDYLKNFGFQDEVTVIGSGINGKMNELQAAFGLLQLQNIDEDIVKRKNVSDQYRILLKDVKSIRVLPDIENVKHNYSYFPIFVDDNYPCTRDELYDKLRSNNIFARRYFYPLITEFPMYNKLETAHSSNLPNATKLANEVICLPIYPGLSLEQIKYISDLIVNV
jgi:dTDP-4-amino-4,6-dideoxygalactose transaminase